MIYQEQIYLSKSFSSQTHFFQFISEKLVEQGVVKGSFYDALTLRESKFPTGLELVEGIGVAIPHTEAIHCLKDSISFIKLKEPVTFLDMEEGVNSIPVRYVFVLTITYPDNHIDVLQNLFSLISSEEFFEDLNQNTTEEQYYLYLKNKIDKE